MHDMPSAVLTHLGLRQPVALDELASGTEARVQQIAADDPAMTRLMALGVCIGHRLRVVQAGDPLIIQVLGTRLGLTARLARSVRVTVCAQTETECQP